MDEFEIAYGPKRLKSGIVELGQVIGVSGGSVWEKVTARWKQKEWGLSVDLMLPDDLQRELGRFGKPLKNEQGIEHKRFIGQLPGLPEAEQTLALLEELKALRENYYEKRGEYRKRKLLNIWGV